MMKRGCNSVHILFGVVLVMVEMGSLISGVNKTRMLIRLSTHCPGRLQHSEWVDDVVISQVGRVSVDR